MFGFLSSHIGNKVLRAVSNPVEFESLLDYRMADITEMTASRQSLAERPAGNHLWSHREKSIHKERGDDGMSQETLQGTPGNSSPIEPSLFSKAGVITARFGLALLPSPVLKLCDVGVDSGSSQHSDTAYLDGLRGAASFAVFAEHFTMQYQPHMFDEFTKPTFLQLPIIRLMYSGNAMVAIFFVISGFALSLRPLEIIHERDWERLHHVMASATFRRGLRIFLPPIVVSFIVMIGMRFHLYDQQYTGGTDMIFGHPYYQPTFWAQFVDWLEYVLGKIIYPYEWLTPIPDLTKSEYAAPLYTIPQEFWSSILLFTTITGLSRVQPAVRFAAVGFLIFFSAWCMRREVTTFLAGMIIAELHLRRQQSKSISLTPSRVYRLIFGGMWVFILFVGLWMASIPHTHGSYGSSTPGYRTIAKLIPWNAYVFSTGAILIIWSISNIEILQKLFSTSFFHYLGQISFSLYLVHWPILAAGGWEVAPVIWRITGTTTGFRYDLGFLLAFLVLAPFVVWAADLFWRFVDLPCIRFAKQFEKELSVEKHI